MTDVLTTILTAPAATPVLDMIIPVFPTVIFRMANPASAVTDRNITRLNPTRVAGLWIAVLWAEKPEPRLVCPEQRPNTTTANLVRNWENTPPVRAARFASMRNVPVCGMPPAVPQIVVIIVTSAADSFIISPPIVIGGAGGGMANYSNPPLPSLTL